MNHGERLTRAACEALQRTGATLVVVVHDNGLAGIAADAGITPEVAANALRHLADHVDGTADCCGGGTIRQLDQRPMPEPFEPPV